ncbi:putative transporter [compost metagenome]
MLLVTFLLTVLTNLTTAVEVGLILSVLLFVRGMSGTLRVSKVLPDSTDKHEKIKAYMVSEGHDCPQISIVTLEGPLFFGTANILEESIMDMIHLNPKILLIRMSKVLYVDTTGESKLARVVKEFTKVGGSVLIAEIQPQSLEVFKKTELYLLIGRDHFFEHTGEAIDYALARIEHDKCIGCKHFVFRECETISDFK